MVVLKNDYKTLEKVQKPQNMKKLSRHPLFGYIILSVILAVVQVLHLYTDIIPLSISLAISKTMVNVVCGFGVGILLMMSGLLSFATGVFMGIGSFLAAHIMKAFILPYVIVLAAVVIVAVIIGALIGVISLRAKGIGLLIITLGIASVLTVIFATPNVFTGGASGIRSIPYPDIFGIFPLSRDSVYFLTLVIMFLLIVVTLNIINSPMGRAMLTMSNSESLAQAMGIKLLRYRVLAFVIATVFAMLSGAMFNNNNQSTLYTTWTGAISMNVLIAVVLGGTAKPAGVLIGSFLMFTIDEAFLRSIPFFNMYPLTITLVNAVLIIVIIAKYPGGLIRLLGSISGGVKKLIAKRRLYKYGEEK